MNIINRVRAILQHPRRFFHTLREPGFKNAWLYFAILSLFTTVLGTLMSIVMQPFATGLMSWFAGMQLPAQPELPAITLAAAALVGYLISLGMVFVSAGILYVYLLIFGGRAGFEQTFQLMVYSSTPNYLFGWIPIAGWLARLWSLCLLIIGTQEVHKLSRLKSILIYAIPLALFLVILLAAMLFIKTLFSSGPEFAAAFSQS